MVTEDINITSPRVVGGCRH